MTRTYYELGLSGRSSCLSCDLDALYTIGETLAPGEYWITVVEQIDEPGAAARLEAEDWGTLEVRGPQDWTLRSLAGLQAGPGYLIV